MSRKQLPTGIKFLNGGLAAMGATCVVQPMDLIKSRMQVSGIGTKAMKRKGTLGVIKSTYQKEGILGFYNGLSAGLFRQGTYAAIRLGCYQTLFDMFSKDGVPPNLFLKIIFGLTAGTIGSFIGTPGDVALIRMTIDGSAPPADRRNYKNVFDALLRVAKEEGVTILWKGAVPTMGRAAVANASQLATYSQAKQYILGTGIFGDSDICEVFASIISGAVTSVVSMPLDIAKTRLQHMKIEGGKAPYHGMIDALIKITMHEGIFALWKGLTPYFLRVTPHTIISLNLLEQLNLSYKNHFM